ncbi:uncharacterized protein isoform X2 [Rhodnius prolixus]|uniref:uncharacterized protein isoform X2 n=1 Tax=Rhodnius prolixus TaxID=13249 RepID=UPI003D18CF34
MQNKHFYYRTFVLLCQFIDFSVVKSTTNKVFEHYEKQVIKRHDSDIQTCLDSFDIHQDKIIRTQDSRDMGAKYINERDVPTRGDCLKLCCETENCDVFVFEEKNPGSCYLFECGTPEDFKCKFTRHHNYTSAVLAINRHLSELETQIKFTQHEHELSKLREPQPQPNVSVLPMKTTTSPKSKEFLQFGIEAPSIRPQRKGCSRNQFECHTDGECIAIYNACDGIEQCQDGSDEAPELHCPGNQVTTALPKLDSVTVIPSSSNLGLLEPYNSVSTNSGETSVGPSFPFRKQWVQQQQYSIGDGSSAIVKNGYPPKPLIGANQNQEASLQNGRANYGREGEGVYNHHPEQWNYQYQQNPVSSQIFTHKGSGLIPQSDRYIQQHPYPPQDGISRNNGQQYSDQAPYYYESVPYRMYPQNQQSNKWQPSQQQHELSGTMVDESPLNHIDQVGFNNAPGDYYYEEPYRNRGKSFPVALNKQLTHSTHSKNQNIEVHDINNNHSIENTNTHRILITAPTPKAQTEKKENNYVQHSHRKIDKLSAEPNVKEVLVDSDYDGHNASPNGAILSLSLVSTNYRDTHCLNSLNRKDTQSLMLTTLTFVPIVSEIVSL